MTGPDAEVEPDPQHPPSPQPQPSLSTPEVTLSAAAAYLSRTCSRSSLIVHILSIHRHLSMDDAASPIDVCQYVCDSGTMAPTPLPLLEDCCSPVVGQVITPAEAETLATSLKAVADPVRLRLISLVAAHADAEACVCDLTDPVGLSQPTVSHHLKVLVDAGLVTRDKRGVWAYYALVPGALEAVTHQLGMHLTAGAAA